MTGQDTAPRILVVEDSRTQAEALRAELEDAGYVVEVAPTGEHAIARFDAERFDLVISDIVMPGSVDGYELCRRIKAGAGRRTPVVLLTSLADPLDIINGLECGADNFLTKPYQPSHLLARLRHLLATREARDTGRLRVGVDVLFLGRKFTISADREQILELLITTFEDAVLQNTELRRREAELELARAELARRAGTSEARMANILDLAEDAIVSVDENLRIILFNRGAEKMMGYTAAEVLGKPFDMLLPAARVDTSRKNLQMFGASLEMGARTGERNEVSGRRKDGSEFPAEASISKLVQDGTTIFTAIVRDVTERRRIEQHLRQVQKLEGIGRLAAGVAHDFNNLLTAITGSAELLLSDLAPADARREEVQEIRLAADRASDLTRQLLAFSRQQVLEPRVIELNAAVTGMSKMLQRLLSDDVVLATSLAPDLGRVLADPGQIEQVILNLVVNGRDAMPNGGQVTIETSNVELDDAYSREHGPVIPGGYVMLAVSDTGTGMDAETRGKIFEPFFTTKGPGQGTGLGLATVYGIVKQSSGNVWVYSELGHGTTFKIYLPRVDAPAQPVRVTTPVPQALDGAETILLVEDNQGVRRLMMKVLKDRGYTLLEAAQPSEALEIASRHGPDIALMVTDVVMPGMSGPELARALSTQREGLRVLYTSGYTADAIATHKVLDPGVNFLQKPFTPDALLRKVRAVLDET